MITKEKLEAQILAIAQMGNVFVCEICGCAPSWRSWRLGVHPRFRQTKTRIKLRR